MEETKNPARQEYFETILDLFGKYFEASHKPQEDKIQERILSISYDRVVELENRIQELETLNSKRVIESAKQDPLI